MRAVNLALLAVAVALGAAGAASGAQTLSAAGFALAVIALFVWVLRSMRERRSESDAGAPSYDGGGADGLCGFAPPLGDAGGDPGAGSGDGGAGGDGGG